jgi:hypothetical protein
MDLTTSRLHIATSRARPDVLQDPYQAKTPGPVRKDPDIPLLPARPMAVEVQPTIAGHVVGFIDDLINVFLDTVKNCTRAPHMVPLAMRASQVGPTPGMKVSPSYNRPSF